MLGFTSERYPQGGALTLNTVSAIGLLSAGIIGTPLLGAAFDRSIHATVQAEAPALEAAARGEDGFMWMRHQVIVPKQANEFLATQTAADQERIRKIYSEDPKGTAQVAAGRDVLAYAVRFPLLLFVVFGVIALWFKSRGGYRPIVLGEGGGNQ